MVALFGKPEELNIENRIQYIEWMEYYHMLLSSFKTLPQTFPLVAIVTDCHVCLLKCAAKQRDYHCNGKH